MEALDILYVGMLPPFQGGVAFTGYQLLDGLAARGHRVRAIAPIATEARHGGVQIGATRDDVAVHWFEMPYLEGWFQTPGPDYRARQVRMIAERLEMLIADRRPDAILVGRSMLLRGVPDLARAHRIPIAAWTHARLDDERARRNPGDFEILLADLGKSNCVVTCARHMQPAYDGLGLTDVVHAVNGIDMALFRPLPKNAALLSSLEIASTRPVAFHASNMKPAKRVLDIVRCADALKARCPDLVWLIVGEGADHDDMVAEVSRRRLGDRFRFTGWVERARMPEYVNLADVTAMPSQSECMAMTYLESMACAVPVVASDVPGAREAMQDGTTGLLHAVGAVEEMADKVAHLMAQPEERRRIGRAARTYVAGHHDIRHNVAQFETILRNILV